MIRKQLQYLESQTKYYQPAILWLTLTMYQVGRIPPQGHSIFIITCHQFDPKILIIVKRCLKFQ